MSPPASPRRFLERLGAPLAASEALRMERVLATARAFLAASALVAVYIQPTRPTRYAVLAYLLLFLYLAQSAVVLALLQIHQAAGPRLQLLVHAADVLWCAAITLLTEGPSSPFFVFFVFVLLAAAYRWGLRETLMTAAVASAFFALEVALTTPGRFYVGRLLDEEPEPNRLVMRAVYLLIMGALLGYLAEQEKLLRAESAVLARTLVKVQPEAGLRTTIETALDEVLRVYDAGEALTIAQESASGRAYLWSARRDGNGAKVTLQLRELRRPDQDSYLFPATGEAWHIVPNRGERGSLRLLALDDHGRRLRNAEVALPDSFLASHPVRSLAAVAFTYGNEWRGRLFVLDPCPGAAREVELRFLQTLVRRIMPAIYSVYLLRHLRRRAGAMERARVARELHDGVIQSLIALEMQMDVLRRRADGDSARLGEELNQMQQLLHQEVLNLRELMEQMTPLQLEPHQLLDFLASTVDKFRRDTAIAASFISDLPEVLLPPHVCRELALIVQEALVNVRRHSGARNVLVSFGAQDGRWRLVVDDNGRGFDFVGRLTWAELEGARRGPLVIKERVRSIGGELTVESVPGRGARLEITLPQSGDA